jgi:NADPH2:quinone reductase
MKAVTIESKGILAIREHANPEAGVGEVLVRVHAAGVNNGDLGQLAGLYPAPSGLPPDVPGLELAGEGGGDRPLSDSVRGRGPRHGHRGRRRSSGTLGRSRASADAGAGGAHRWEQAGGFAEAFITAHDALFTQGGLRPGERVLINGAAGGVGVAGVQMAAAAGAEVIASVRNPGSRDAIRRLGAAKAIDPTAAEADGPYDVVLELVGATNFETNLRSLRSGGRIVIIGAGSGRDAKLDLGLLAAKRATVRSSTLRASRTKCSARSVVTGRGPATSEVGPARGWTNGQLSAIIAP